MTTQPPVAVIGLGNMGLAMAGHLAGAGFKVRGFDLSAERCGLAPAAHVALGKSTTEAAEGAAVLCLSLPHAQAVEATLAECLAATAPDCVVVDTSTLDVAAARRLAATVAESGRAYLDAPVSGGPAGAASGALTMMVGGDAAALSRARPVLEAMAARIVHVGASGAGQVAKLTNNLLVAAHLVAAAEAVRMAERAGVAAEDVLAVVNAASGRSAATEVNLPRWVLSGRFDSGFAAGLMRKDVRLALALAKAGAVDTPVLARAAETWLAHSASAVADLEDFNHVASWVMAGGHG